jgi:hypothetical protein
MKTKRTTIKRRNIAALLRGKSQAAERLALVSRFPLIAPLEIAIAETSWQPVPRNAVRGNGVAAYALAGF